MRAGVFVTGIVLAGALAPAARSQTVDEIAHRYIAATGGAERWAAVQSFAVSSRSPYFSSNLWQRRPDRVRIDSWSDAAADSDVRAVDGVSGWRLSSFEGSSKPRTMSASEVADLREEADWMLELVDYKAKGHKIALLRTEPVGGRPAYRLELTRPSGAVVHIFLDQKTGLEVQRIRWGRSPAGEDLELVLPVGDYRTVGGVLLPHRVGPATRSYEVNGAIPDSVFRKPGAATEREMARERMASAAARLLPIGSEAPAWELMNPQGRVHRSSEFRGRVLVMDFWATWCAPCHRVMPELQRLHEDFSNDGVIVLAISTSERGGDPAQLMKDRGYSYTLLLNGESIADRFQVTGLPTVYVIGTDGRIVHADVGADAASGAARRASVARQVRRVD